MEATVSQTDQDFMRVFKTETCFVLVIQMTIIIPIIYYHMVCFVQFVKSNCLNRIKVIGLSVPEGWSSFLKIAYNKRVGSSRVCCSCVYHVTSGSISLFQTTKKVLLRF